MTGNKKIIHFLSASDRLNYGDLLFPLVFREVMFRKGLAHKFINYGIVKTNLSFFGALPTQSYKSFQRNVRKLGGNVIIGGGEVLFVDWGSLYAFIKFFYSRLLYNTFFSRFEKKYNFTRYLLSNGKVMVPFAPNRFELESAKKVKIFYNAVGGTFRNSRLSNKEAKFRLSLESSAFISVRDERVQKSLLDYGLCSNLTPDSALLVSDFFNMEYLTTKISFDKNIFKKKYLFLQIGKDYAPQNLRSFSTEIRMIADNLNCEVVLCPIGLAPRHEDDKILKMISTFSLNFRYFSPQSIYDIMFLIANAKVYLGTSLHGLITAQSFDTPFIPLNKRLFKVEEYCKTWTKKNISKCLNYDGLYEVPEIVLNWDYQTALKEKNRQKKLVYQNFDKIEGQLL